MSKRSNPCIAGVAKEAPDNPGVVAVIDCKIFDFAVLMLCAFFFSANRANTTLTLKHRFVSLYCYAIHRFEVGVLVVPTAVFCFVQLVLN